MDMAKTVNAYRNKAGTKQEKSSLLRETLARTVKSPSSKVGVILFALMVLLAIFAPLIAPYGANSLDIAHAYETPTWAHLMGTDALGRDIFSRLLYGSRYSIAIGVATALFGALLSIIFGCIAGYFGGIVETIIMRFLDIWTSLPSILLCILISATLGGSFFTTVIALTVGQIPNGVRLIRGQILSERTKEYLEAAESINCSKLSIMFRHLLPNVISPLIVMTTMGIGNAITTSATLSYIGLGVQPPTPEWGAMLSAAKGYIRHYPYQLLYPGLAIAILVLAMNLLGDGLRDAMDPKLKN